MTQAELIALLRDARASLWEASPFDGRLVARIEAALAAHDAKQAEVALADSFRWFEVNDGGSLMAETETHRLFVHPQKSIETGAIQYRWVCLPWAEGARGFSDYRYEDSMFKAKVAAIRFSRGER